jgi:alpha-L-fucosidase
VWFDGEWEGTWTHEKGMKLYDYVRSLQPDVIVNNRVDSGRAGMEGFSKDEQARGDYGTPEQTIPANGMPGKDWETCMTMNDTWGYKTADVNWKSSSTLIRMLCDIASKGGNFLLNVGPKPDGTIPQESIERLHRVGEWMRTNGTAIHGTDASPFPRKFGWGRVTRAAGPVNGREGTTLNLIVFEWPKDGTLRLPGIGNEPMPQCAVLGAPDRRPTAARDADGIVVSNLGAAPVDADATVVRIAVVGTPQVEPFFIAPGPDGRLALDAAEAVTTGSIQYEERFHNLGWWNDLASVAGWTIRTKAAGEYEASIDYAADAGCGGELAWEILRDGHAVDAGTVALPARSGWGDFARLPLGRMHLPAGQGELRIRAKSKSGDSFANVRNVVLTPSK